VSAAPTRAETDAERTARLRLATPGAIDPLPLFTTAALWKGYTAPGYIAKRIVEPRALTTIFGDQGTYKSAVAVALACSIGSGRPFYEIKTRKAGVLYVAGEGCGGMRKRLRAYMIGQGLSAADPQPAIAVTEAPADLIGNADQLRATVRQAEKEIELAVEAIFFDTLAANFGSGEENSASDMALAIANARSASPGAAIVVVHHSGLGDGSRERGSSALPFGSDFRFRTVYNKAARTIELRNVKAKDDELLSSLFFTPRRLGVEWLDSDGEELTAVVLDRGEEPPEGTQEGRPRTATAGLGSNQESLLKALRRLYKMQRKALTREGRDPETAKILLDGLRNVVVDEKLLPAKRFSEAIDALLGRGLIRVEGAHVLLSGED